MLFDNIQIHSMALDTCLLFLLKEKTSWTNSIYPEVSNKKFILLSNFII